MNIVKFTKAVVNDKTYINALTSINGKEYPIAVSSKASTPDEMIAAIKADRADFTKKLVLRTNQFGDYFSYNAERVEQEEI